MHGITEELSSAVINKISRQQANQLERSLVSNPGDLSARIKLLGFYFGKSIWCKEDLESHCRHVFWFIENAPEHDVLFNPLGMPLYFPKAPELFKKGEELWQKQLGLYEDNPRVIANAAHHYCLFGVGKSIELLERCVKLDPDNKHWKSQLATTCERAAKFGNNPKLAARALELREELSLNEKENNWKKILTLVDLAQAAYQAEEWDRCDIAATEAITTFGLQATQKSFLSCRYIHDAFTLKGLLALRNANLSSARDNLLNSVSKQTLGSEIESISPEFDLAQALLKMDEIRVVSKYLLLCATETDSRSAMLFYWWLLLACGLRPKLESNGAVELFMPRWLDPPVKYLLKLMA